ncbi:peptidoglycan-recognition protein LC isoform X1 [Aedes albopictus]|uniref:Peptidoglycan recognition protein long class n=1 Tax=Aedes albopictus TaxID=7160 RepID=A0ABM2A0L2_AEDAL|nr:peptidoglycan-recognition protein LC-like isoform X1 [Aedes albopictus]XP_029716876.1 peptidoglycan-recognition protein LC-like isoform X1 [Aedes albopictus]
MAKARSQQNTPSTDAAPSSPLPSTSALTSPDNCAGPSNSNNAVQPSQSTTIDKADTTSSHNISISSINEDDNNDSSAFETSDSECDDEQIKKAIERIPNSLQPGSQLVQNGMLVVKDDNNSSPVSARGPNIGSIAVQNSSDITFGNKTYIKGQVVIKNIYHDKQNGAVNEGYHETDGELNKQKSNKDSSNANKDQSWQSSLKVIIRDKPMLSVVVLIAVMVIITTIVIVAFVSASGKPKYKRYYGDGDDDRANVPPDTGIDKDFLPDAKPLRIVTRNEWLAQPPKENLTRLKLPVNRVIIAHTATENCQTQAQCTFMTQRIQEFHMAEDSKNYSDIAYNFLIGGDGNAYVGRDWDKQGAHTKGFNVDSIGIAFIGTFTDVEPSLVQLSAAEQLIAMGFEQNKLSKTYRLYGHRQLAPFESPGRMLFKIIQKWPHWSSELGSNHWQE